MSADLLGQGAVAWRGRPAAWASGDMGEVGERFDAAFSELPPGRPAALAFEYFTGLVFNADYGDLNGLRALVASWLEWLTVRLRLPKPMSDVLDRTLPDYIEAWPILYQFTPAVAYHSTPIYTDPLGTGWRGRLFAEHWPMPQAGYWISLYEVGDEESLGAFIAAWHGNTWDVLLMGGPSHGHYPDFGGIHVDPGGPSGDFTEVIRAAAGTYVGLQEVVERDYPEPAATAETANGWVFSSWAQGLFGLPVAG